MGIWGMDLGAEEAKHGDGAEVVAVCPIASDRGSAEKVLDEKADSEDAVDDGPGKDEHGRMFAQLGIGHVRANHKDGPANGQDGAHQVVRVGVLANGRVLQAGIAQKLLQLLDLR